MKTVFRVALPFIMLFGWRTFVDITLLEYIMLVIIMVCTSVDAFAHGVETMAEIYVKQLEACSGDES